MKSFARLYRQLYRGLIFPLLVLNGWLLIVVLDYFWSPIAIFVTASLLAFILNYPVHFLIDRRIKRTIAILIVVGITLLLIGIVAVTLAPIIIEQLNQLETSLPSWITSGDRQMQSLNKWAIERKLPLDISGLTNQIINRLSSQLQSLTGQILDLIWGAVDSVFNLLLTLILTFYLLLHGEELWQGIWEWLPIRSGQLVRPLLRQNFHNYYVGQASLAAIVGVTMTVAFLFLQIPFGLLFGLGVGLMALIPFGAPLSICLVSLLMALKSFWLGIKVLLIAIVLEQAIENGIAPRLLGGFTGLNPVWILLSLLIGTKVGGILGLLIAVPSAGFIKSTAVVLRTNRLNSSQVKAESKIL